MKYINIKIKNTLNNKRLDISIKYLLNNKYSRNKIINLIKNKNVSINNKIIIKPSKIIKKNDLINIFIKNNIKKYLPYKKLILNKIYEDKDILIINKNKNTVIHPGHGNTNNTIMNSLIYYYNSNSNIPRYGIIHRLDKDTTGILIISKNINSYIKLKKKIKEKKITKIYKAIVYGIINKNGIINKPICRNKYNRIKMCVNKNGKKSITHYNIIENFNNCTLLNIKLITGRTHQIRVHMNYINHPIIGEKIYTNKNTNKYKMSKKINILINKLNRQALHASTIKFKHPINKKKIKIDSKIPKDLLNLIFYLRLEKL